MLAVHSLNSSPTSNDQLLMPVLIEGIVGSSTAAGIPHAQVGNPGAAALTRFEAHFDPLGQHVRFYTRRSLAATLEHAGFEDVRVRRGLTAWAYRR